MRRNGLRIALLGFAPYRWATRLEQVRVAQALVRKAAAQADLVVVAMHAGAEGSGATHVPRGTETFLGENRGDSRRFAHAVIDAGADLVVGSGPHVIRGMERYHGRLIAYSTGNFAGYKNFGTGGTLSLSAILRVHAARRRRLRRRHWVSLRLDGNALPHPDPSNASARLVAQLSREDFGVVRGARSPRTGRSSRDVRSAPCHLSRHRRGARAEIALPLAGLVGRDKKERRARLEGQPRRRRPRRAADRSAPMRRWRLWPLLLALLVVNYWVASTFPDKPARARIAYSPQFLSEVKEQQRQPGHDHRAERRGRVQASRSRSTRRSSRASRRTSRRCRPTTRCSALLKEQQGRDQRQVARLRARSARRRSCSASARRC